MNSEVKNLRDVYENSHKDVYRDNEPNKGIGYYIKQPFGLIPLFGGCLISGALGAVGGIGGGIKELPTQIPYLLGAEETTYGLGQRLLYVAKECYESGSDIGGDFAAAGFIGGVIFTAMAKEKLKNFLGIRR
jgi:hypothetical protein